MASEDYLPLFRKARREHLGNIARVSAEIIKLYREAAADLAARAAASRKGSLTERWASEYAESLKKRTAELNAGLYEVTLQGLKRSAGLPTIAMGEWWEAVATTQGAAGQSFRDAFATTPDSVLAGIIEGGFYNDNKGLSERIWRVADSFEKDIGYIVNRGIAEKKSALELARDLEQYVKPPAKRDFDWGKVYPNLSGKKVDFNAQRLARTSINHAYHLDNVKVCTENPFVTAMHWDLSNSHYERQIIPFGSDECDEYAAHEEGLGEGNWKPEEIPVPHPQCLCTHWPVIPQDLEDIGAQIGRWASGEPDAVLDEWYDKYGNQNPNGDPKEILRNGGKAAQTGDNQEYLLKNQSYNDKIRIEQIGTVDFSDKQQIIEQLKQAEQAAAGLDYEVNTTITTDGKVWQVQGEESTVDPSGIPSNLIGSFSYHNHPDPKTHYSFSGEDAAFFISEGEAYESASDSEYRYIMQRRNDTPQLDYQTVFVRFEEVYNTSVLQMSMDSMIDIDVDGYHETMRILGEEMNFDYEREKKNQ